MTSCDICDKLLKNTKAIGPHRRWHDLPQYKKFQNNFIKQMSHGINSPANRRKTSIRHKGNKHALGHRLTEYHKKIVSVSHMGERNHEWKGNNVGYTALHLWIRRHKTKSDRCQKCDKITTKLDLANISGKYKRDINDFEWLCRKCHMIKDLGKQPSPKLPFKLNMKIRVKVV